jgi:hypothetical protein
MTQLKNDQFHVLKVIHCGTEFDFIFSRRQRRARSFFAVGARRRTVIGIGLAFVGPIGITASGEDMSMMSQPIEQSVVSFSSAKTLTHSENAKLEVMMVDRRSWRYPLQVYQRQVSLSVIKGKSDTHEAGTVQ